MIIQASSPPDLGTTHPRTAIPDLRTLLGTCSFDLKNCLIALQRCLYVSSPSAAEELWSLRTPGTVAASLPVPPPTALREFFRALIEQLTDSDPVDSRWKAPLREKSARIYAMEHPHAIHSVMAANLEPLREALAANRINGEWISEYLAKVGAAHSAFFITSPVAGDLSLIATIVGLAWPMRYSFGSGFRMDQLLADNSLESFLTAITQQAPSRGEIMALMRKGCLGMQSKGEELQDSTVAVESIAQFYAQLFASTPWLRGASRGLDFLRRQDQAGFHSSAWDLTLASNMCDVRSVVAGAAMMAQFADSLDSRDLFYRRDEIQEERARNGDAAAERRADQILETEMLYPPFAKPFLLGQTTLFASRRPSG